MSNSPSGLDRALDYIGQQIAVHSPEGAKIKNENEAWLSDKKLSYRGDAYIQQLEKNAIYNVERAFGICDIIAELLIAQGNIDSNKIMHMMGTKHEAAHAFVGTIVSWIAGDSASASEVIKARYAGLRKIKTSNNSHDYIKELESWCYVYRPMAATATSYVQFLADNSISENLVSGINREQLKEHISKKVYFWSNVAIGNVHA